MDSTVVTSDPAEEPLYSRIDHSSSTESQPAAVHHHHHHHHDGMCSYRVGVDDVLDEALQRQSFVMQTQWNLVLFNSTRIDCI